jgi:methionyl-tRNA formyltransferase
LLPRWRGAAPIQRAIEAGDSESGVTIMLMDAGLDTGPMLAHGPCAITAQTSSGDLYEQLAEIGPALLLEVLEYLPGHLSNATVQNDEQANYAAKITKEEALIDWTADAAAIARRVNAFNPAPGCYSFFDGQRLKIWAAQAVTNESKGLPGSILTTDDRGIAVRCGDGAILLQNLQMPGSKAMQASDLLRGRGELFAPGKRFVMHADT